MTKKDIAIIGGTFDPIHIGHIDMVKYFTKNYIVDEVWILPSYYSPHKEFKSITSFENRVNMIKMSIKDFNNVLINTFEKEYYEKFNTKTYTYEILNELKKLYLNCRFHFAVGFDSIKNIYTWHNYKDLIKDYWFYIFDRPDNEFITIDTKINYLNNLGKNFGVKFIYELFNIKITDISSTQIRNYIKEKKYTEALKYLNDDVLDFIIKNKLYE